MTTPSEPVALLNCPFCGENLVYVGGYLDWFTHAARDWRSTKCIAHNINIVRDRRDRIELWNRRSPQQPAPHSKSQAKRQALQRGESPRLGAQQPAQEALKGCPYCDYDHSVGPLCRAALEAACHAGPPVVGQQPDKKETFRG